MAVKRERIRSVIAKVTRQELAAVEVAMVDLLALVDAY